jgi:hypothetical protein
LPIKFEVPTKTLEPDKFKLFLTSKDSEITAEPPKTVF